MDLDYEKRARRISAGFAQAPLPLRRLYVLAEGEPARIEPLDKPAALVELVRHSYMANSRPPGAAATHLRQCAALPGGARLSRLKRPLCLEDLPAIARMVGGHDWPSFGTEDALAPGCLPGASAVGGRFSSRSGNRLSPA